MTLIQPSVWLRSRMAASLAFSVARSSANRCSSSHRNTSASQSEDRPQNQHSGYSRNESTRPSACQVGNDVAHLRRGLRCQRLFRYLKSIIRGFSSTRYSVPDSAYSNQRRPQFIALQALVEPLPPKIVPIFRHPL